MSIGSCNIKAEKPSLKRYFKPYRKELAATLVCAIITVWSSLALPVIIRWVIDGLANDTVTKPQLLNFLALFLLIGTLSIVFSRLIRKIPLNLSHKIEYELRADLFKHLTTLDQSFYRHERTGDLMTKMSSDINIIRDSIGQGLLQGIRTIITLLSAAVVMTWADPQLTAITFSLFTPMVIVFFLVLRLMRRYQQELQEHISEVSNFCQESFTGIRCIKGFALEQRRGDQFHWLNRDLIRKTMRMQCSRQSLFPFMAFWFNLGTILIFIIGGKRIIRGDLTLGTLTQFTQYLLYMQWPLLALSWVMSMLQRGKVSWLRVRDILETAPQINDAQVAEPAPRITDASIQFEQVNFSLDQRPLLSNINLFIPAGTTLGITGPTGSGKTLLTSLVARLIDPDSGTLKIGGHPLKTIPLNQLRRMIGYAAQEPILFSQTLKNNIGFGLENAEMEQIEWAANIAHLHQEVDAFPDQYETMLGERGVTLSGGQRQRASISRAIARHPDILILDDVLSAVDTQTEASIMKKLKPVMDKRTTLFVSHRISTLRYSDEIIVIEKGCITQRGTHEELIQQPGYYAELNTMQHLQEQLEEES